jgi:hypothetical protein
MPARKEPMRVMGHSEHDLVPQPNEFDQRRIERLLAKRLRYKYVKPVVRGIDRGYQIQSPCCSRNIDAGGGMVDIARMVYDVMANRWDLYRKDYESGEWKLVQIYRRLSELLDYVNQDPERQFWQ